VVVCSIFVNPTQFNDPKDLERYPRPIADDTAQLANAGCDILFNPAVTEMYAGNEQWHLDIGPLEFVLEGKFRPGHYQGVTQVVFKLFDIVKPDTAFFGQKDYQQFMVINRMVQILNLPIELVMCPIVREADGLAMSSRNIHLSATERLQALALSKILFWVRDEFDRTQITALQQNAFEQLQQADGVQAEYLEIADGKTLQPANQNSKTIVALVAARVGQTRLIDNVLLW
jgi:pantoate--beta-alanine ligase